MGFRSVSISLMPFQWPRTEVAMAPLPPSTSLTTQEAAIQITRDNETWTGQLGQPVNLLYGFLSYGYIFTEKQIQVTKEVLDLWADLANINFIPANPDDPYINNGLAQFTFTHYYDS